MKAINVILARERLDRERKKKEDSKRARIEMENAQDAAASSFVALAPSATPLNTNVAPLATAEPPRHAQLYQVENASRGSPLSASMATPPESSESPIVPVKGSSGEGSHFSAVNASVVQSVPPQSVIEGVYDRLATVGMGGTRHGSVSSQAAQAAMNATSWPAANVASQAAGPRRRSLAMETVAQLQTQAAPGSSSSAIRAEISRLVSDLTPDYTTIANANNAPATTQPTQDAPPREGGPYRGLDVDTLRALRRYVYNEDSNVQMDDDTLLRRLETAWREGVRSDYNRVLDNIAIFIARERAILTWIELKRHIADLARADQRTSLLPRSEAFHGCANEDVAGWHEEGSTAAEIQRRIQQHRTLMGASRELLRNYEDITQVAGSDVDNDELLRQAFVVLAGPKYAVELQWKTVEFMGAMEWLSVHLERFRREEEEEGEGVYFVG